MNRGRKFQYQTKTKVRLGCGKILQIRRFPSLTFPILSEISEQFSYFLDCEEQEANSQGLAFVGPEAGMNSSVAADSVNRIFTQKDNLENNSQIKTFLSHLTLVTNSVIWCMFQMNSFNKNDYLSDNNNLTWTLMVCLEAIFIQK